MKIYTVTLAYNLVSETQKACERLYRQNEKNFTHIICDLGFPLATDTIPDDIEEAKNINSENLKALASRFGATYVKFNNEGCSNNWNQALEFIQPKDSDVIVSCEPDEVQNENGWVNALADVIKGGMAYCAPRLVEHKTLLETSTHVKLEVINGHEVYVMNANLNYGQIAMGAKFINKIGGIPTPSTMQIYGGLEVMLKIECERLGLRWGLLKNITTTHTDYEKGTPNTSKLLREWKNFSVFSGKPQVQFDVWLEKQKINA